LLIWHTKLHLWLQPGGHIDPKDVDVFAAARREVAEEAGVTTLHAVGDGLFDLDVHVIPARPNEPAHSHFDVRLLFRCQDASLVAGSDAGDARWVGVSEVSPTESDESVMRAVRKLRHMGIR
jgi:8-oxo-dGTP pyrophosphatase MutT (NUDIX family)